MSYRYRSELIKFTNPRVAHLGTAILVYTSFRNQNFFTYLFSLSGPQTGELFVIKTSLANDVLTLGDVEGNDHDQAMALRDRHVRPKMEFDFTVNRARLFTIGDLVCGSTRVGKFAIRVSEFRKNIGGFIGYDFVTAKDRSIRFTDDTLVITSVATNQTDFASKEVESRAEVARLEKESQIEGEMKRRAEKRIHKMALLRSKIDRMYAAIQELENEFSAVENGTEM